MAHKKTKVQPKRVSGHAAEHFLNRELQALEFNRRVLAQAEDKAIPILERLKFLCIVSSNLDEFFEIRVSGLKEQIKLGAAASGPRPYPLRLTLRGGARARLAPYRLLTGYPAALAQENIRSCAAAKGVPPAGSDPTTSAARCAALDPHRPIRRIPFRAASTSASTSPSSSRGAMPSAAIRVRRSCRRRACCRG